ncbi:MAG TPA: glycosyltransferase family 39 protein, partial [Verrucomicrobiota bacterium]|nr:dolichyl-phosphate-mannose--protein mannosyltransferase [Verrucomicrobiales bacterium]HRI16452.1 glycosyltransferase family 39 protein [Verrucomicrobiota bacterium]
YNDQVYLDKPAAYFKAVALSLAVFGDNEFGARLPSALCAFATLGLTFAFCRREFGKRTAAFSILVVATTPLFFIHARIVIFDIALALFVCASIFAGYRAEEAEGSTRRRWYLLGSAACGMATLIKGPVGFAIPSLVLAVFHLVEGRPSALLRLFHPLNFLVFFAVVLPWFVGLSLAHPDFPHYGLVEETFNRFTTTSFRRTKPFYFYAWIVPATFFPWSLLLPEAGIAALRRWKLLPRASRFSIVWCVVVVIFFSLSKSKLPGYVLSVAAPFGILAAQLLDHALSHPAGVAARILRRMSLALALIAVVGLAALVLVAPQTQLLHLQIPKVDLTQFSFAFIPMLILALVIVVTAGWSWYRQQAGTSIVAFGLLPVLLVVLGSGAFSAIYERRSARGIAAVLPVLPAATELAFYRCMPNGLPFYLRQTGTLITKDGGELSSNYVKFALRRNPSWPKGMVPLDGFESWLASRRSPVYLIAYDSDEGWLRELAAKRGTTVQPLPQRFFGALFPAPRGS